MYIALFPFFLIQINNSLSVVNIARSCIHHNLHLSLSLIVVPLKAGMVYETEEIKFRVLNHQQFKKSHVI